MVFIFLLVIMEIVFRVMGFGFGYMPFEMDPVLRHVHPKNYEFTIYDQKNEFGGHKITYDDNRRRIPEDGYNLKESQKEIWFLGDSFTEAKEVKWKDSYVGIVDSEVDVNVLNYGTMGYSPLLYFIQIKNELKSGLIPDMVFIQLYSNDISDEENYSHQTTFDNNDKPVSCFGGNPSLTKMYLRKSYVMRVARRAQMTTKYLLNKKSEDEENEVDDFVEHNDPWNENHRFTKSIFQLHSLLNSVGVEHYFFSIPSKYACISGDWVKSSFTNNFNDMALKDSLPFIDLNPAFRKNPKPKELFFDFDIHCNENGNSAIASELLKKINY